MISNHEAELSSEATLKRHFTFVAQLQAGPGIEIYDRERRWEVVLLRADCHCSGTAGDNL